MVLCSCSVNVKKNQFVNSLRFNYCITILCKCTCAAFIITKIQMLYNDYIVTLCDQYLSQHQSTGVKITLISVLRYIYTYTTGDIDITGNKVSLYGNDLIVLRKSDVSITMSLPCTMYFHDPSKLRWER